MHLNSYLNSDSNQIHCANGIKYENYELRIRGTFDSNGNANANVQCKYEHLRCMPNTLNIVLLAVGSRRYNASRHTECE